jgi:hypothetical protein
VHRGIENSIKTGSVENGVRLLIEILDLGGMNTLDGGIGNGVAPFAELAQQRLGAATGLTLKSAFVEYSGKTK